MNIDNPPRRELLDPATQIVRDRGAYLGDTAHDIGRRIGDDQIELFVSGDPAVSLQAQIDRVKPAYIALHDVGGAATLRLLGALAGAAKARLQRLSIRRQGHGLALATIPFTEVPIGADRRLRLYSTDVDADSATRRALAHVLLGNATVAAVMVAELPAHALAAAMEPLREVIARGPWPNRELLLLPLGSAVTLAAQAPALAGRSGVSVRVTPHALRPADAWAFIGGAWNRSGGTPVDTDLQRAAPSQAVAIADAPTQPMGLEPPPARSSRWDGYALRCARLRGVGACVVFDVATGVVLAQAGNAAAPVLAVQGQALHEASARAGQALGFAPGAPEVLLAIGEQHLLLRPLPGHPGIAAALLLQGAAGSVTLARLQLERVSLQD